MPLFATVNFAELGNDWRPEAHIRVKGLLLFQHRRVQEIKRIRNDYQHRIEKLNEEEREILAQG
jgi:hypothetical protein